MKKPMPALLFWGAVWGILEATGGYALHFLAVALPGLPGALLFPLGFFCMYRAQRAAGTPSAALWTAAIAASVKLVNFILPGHDPIRVINPALSILLEGLAVAAVSARLRAGLGHPGMLPALAMGLVWRALFAGYLAVISRYGLPAGLVTSGAGVLLRFVLLESLINAALIRGAFALRRAARPRPDTRIRPGAAVSAYLLALGLQALL